MMDSGQSSRLCSLLTIFRSRRRNGKRMKDSFPRVGYGGGTVIGSVGEMTDPSAYERLPTAEDVVQ